MFARKKGIVPKGLTAAAAYLASAGFKMDTALRQTLRPAHDRDRPSPRWRSILDDLEIKFVVSSEPLVDVTKVEVLPDHVLRLEFSNGKHGLFSMTPYLSEPPYDRLTAPEFALAHIAHGTVVWPGGIEIAPETLVDPTCRM
ncbi:MAG: DUF2442 domain-containing protein [Rhodocyclaceae bacterium]|nr:DUF2442 domain-containing protein [Rhodocyclaceae bacterium]